MLARAHNCVYDTNYRSESYYRFSFALGGTLFNLIQQKSNQGFKGIPEGEVLEIVSDIVKGLLHMHL